MKSLEAINFLSWAHLVFPLEEGVTSIVGFNHDDGTPEGSGKSAIPNAICWGLYGKLPKDSNVDDVIREGEKSCEVKVPVGECYVVRKRKPNDLYIVSPDGQEVRGKDARETQQLIEDLVGLSFDTFCQTVYFAQNYAKKFILANQEEKGKILSEIQELKQFDDARKKAQDRIKNTKMLLLVAEKDKERFDTLLKEKEATLELTKSNVERFYVEQRETIERIGEKLQSIESKILTEKKELKKLKKAIKGEVDTSDLEEAKKEVRKQIDDLNQVIAEKKVKSRNISKEAEEKERAIFQFKRTEKELIKTDAKLDKLKEALKNPAQCPTCGSDIDPKRSKFHSDLHQEIAELEETRKSLEKDWDLYDKKRNVKVYDSEELDHEIKEHIIELGNLRQVLDEIDDKILEYKSKSQKVSSLQKEIERLEQNQEDLQAEIEEESEKEPTHLLKQLEEASSSIDETKKALKDVSKKVDKLTLELARLETLKDGYREVKVYVFQAILDELTRKANEYLRELFEQDVKIRFTNEDMKISTEVTIDGQPRPLGLYSGGQFRRISLAVDLALSDITTARKGSVLDLVCLDEYFKDLSEISMEKALKLLEKRKGTTLLIEHNSIFQNIIDRVFEVELLEGISRCKT